MGGSCSSVTWESPAGGKFRVYSRFYDVYGLDDWLPANVHERIIDHPSFQKVGTCFVAVELKGGTHEIEFRKNKPWSEKEVKNLDKALASLPGPYHWWGLVIIRPHLRRVLGDEKAKIVEAQIAATEGEKP